MGRLDNAIIDDYCIHVVEALLEKGGCSNEDLRSAIQTAANLGKRGMIDLLLKYGADLDSIGGPYGGNLHAAVHSDNQTLAQALLQMGARVDAQDGPFGTALQAAAWGRKKKMVEILLKSGADVNATGGLYGTALQAAAYLENITVTKTLLKAGADVNVQGGRYGTALQAAAHFWRQDMVERLIKAGADVNIQGGLYGNALKAAVHRGSMPIIEMLLKAGADVNAQCGDYGTALQIAVASNNAPVVDLLLCNQASITIDSRAADGSSLLHAVVSSGNLNKLNFLLARGAKRFLHSKNSSGQTPFLLAVSRGNLPMSERLYSLMEDQEPAIEERDIDGRTPLHFAVERQNVSLVEWLLDKGAKVDTLDFSDVTPFQRASDLGNFQILYRLFPRMVEGHRLIKASAWRFISQNVQATIELTRGPPPSVEILTGEQFEQYMKKYSYSLSFNQLEVPAQDKSLACDLLAKRLFLICNDSHFGNTSPWGLRSRWWRKTAKAEQKFESYQYQRIPMAKGFTQMSQIWTAKLNTVPSPVTLGYVLPGACFLECRIILPKLQLHETRRTTSPLDLSLLFLEREHCIVWIMVKPDTSWTSIDPERRLLKSTIFFSTLEHAAVPDTAAELCIPLIRQLYDEWDSFYRAAEQHLNDRRIQVLESRGLEEGLTKALLQDARLWNTLSRLLEGQGVALLSSFETANWEMLFEDDGEMARALIEDANWLITETRQKIRDLTAISQELIQLEFNLTSIAEAQKSTTMNRSMKRLSWITFIFLPLMFISSLFGMNVDILEFNPSWWWYLPIAGGTTTLTLIVWITFKRNRNLENVIEKKFAWLLRPKSGDEEKGWSRGKKFFWNKKAKAY